MLKKMVFLGTGGTIAGTADSAADNVGYKAAQVGVELLLEAIPSLSSALGDHVFESEQVLQIDSKDMGWAQWTTLARRICHHMAQPDVCSIVVTHGTDTLEETAYFLARVLPRKLLDKKPVVLTCAMRPASSLSPDGPQNVLDAVIVARSKEAHGVLAVCAGTVHSARDVQKIHTYRLNAFDSGEAGPLGYVEEGSVRWLHACPTTVAIEAGSVEQLPETAWPRVEIVISYVGATGATVRALCQASADAVQPVRGIVVAGTGNGTIHEDLETALREAQAGGIRVMRATRCGRGSVVAGVSTSDLPHSHGLSPVKARIALVLDLLS
ncbi:MAG: asparaginase [Pseudomonadota bacterium]